jgi:4a-hydroxytetrahydrobiopterin dehydratase
MAAVLDPGAVDAALTERQLRWTRRDRTLDKIVRLADFAEALAFVNEVGALAETADHHPDIDIRWNTVTLHLSTHSAGGITEADLRLAHDIDGIDNPPS